MAIAFKVIVLISGRGSNLKALLDTLPKAAAPIEIDLVVSDQADAAGLEIARKANIKTVIVPREPNLLSRSEYSSRLAAVIKEHEPNLIVLAGFMRILSPEFIREFPEQIINIHPSLLPSFPGLEVQQQAIDAGVRFSGCTVHFVTEEIDGGPIIGQAVVPVLTHDTAESLAERILKQEHKLLPACVEAIARGDIKLENHNGKKRVFFRGVPNLSLGSQALISITRF